MQSLIAFGKIEQPLHGRKSKMLLNAIKISDGRILIFRADVEFNQDLRKMIDNISHSIDDFSYDIDKQNYYFQNKDKIDNDIKMIGYSIFNLTLYECHSASRHEAVVKAIEKHALLKN